MKKIKLPRKSHTPRPLTWVRGAFVLDLKNSCKGLNHIPRHQDTQAMNLPGKKPPRRPDSIHPAKMSLQTYLGAAHPLCTVVPLTGADLVCCTASRQTHRGSLLKNKNSCTGSRTSYSQVHILENKLLEHLIPMTLVLRSSLNSTAVPGRSLRLSLQIPPRLQEASLQAHSLFSNGQIPLILNSSLKFREN